MSGIRLMWATKLLNLGHEPLKSASKIIKSSFHLLFIVPKSSFGSQKVSHDDVSFETTKSQDDDIMMTCHSTSLRCVHAPCKRDTLNVWQTFVRACHRPATCWCVSNQTNCGDSLVSKKVALSGLG